MPRQQRAARHSCPNNECQLYGQSDRDNIILYSVFRLKHGTRRRYCCKTCGRTFCSTTGTVYHRIHKFRNTFDEVCTLSVEGLSKSAIARTKKLSWNTVARWLERAADIAKKFNEHRLRGFLLHELQLDEIRTFLHRKKCPIGVITAIEVWSRLWPSCVLGRRNYFYSFRCISALLSVITRSFDSQKGNHFALVALADRIPCQNASFWSVELQHVLAAVIGDTEERALCSSGPLLNCNVATAASSDL